MCSVFLFRLTRKFDQHEDCMQRIIDSYDLLYLDPVRMLPISMTEHLNKHTISALSPAVSRCLSLEDFLFSDFPFLTIIQHAPDTLSLHALTNRLAKRVSTYGIFTPDFNAAPVLWRAVRCLGGMRMLTSPFFHSCPVHK
jgi:RNA polymerase I-specific transcription initiation factor RRN7